MKVLWFEMTMPSGYINKGIVVCGWQDSLERVIRKSGEFELFIAFQSDKETEIKIIDGVTYIPMSVPLSRWMRQKSSFSWKYEEKSLIPQMIKVVERVKPDLIHVFGCECPFGLVAKHTRVPVVIHIQGSIVPYNNALFPPTYSDYTIYRSLWPNLRKIFRRWKSRLKDESRLDMEKRIWKDVRYYMGRTKWDYALSHIMRPDCSYFHVDEALRPSFLNGTKKWHCPDDGKLHLITTGISSFWKGPDMLLKTAKILHDLGVNFEWKVAGNLNAEFKKVVEEHEKTTFEDNNVNILGFTQADELCDILCNSTMMVHTAYIENSPNAICEAQCLGVPVVSTNVGGISTLVRDGIDGILIPANDPWQMAYNIITLAKDKERMMQMSLSTREFALKRHSTENILSQLLSCYKSIVENNQRLNSHK